MSDETDITDWDGAWVQRVLPLLKLAVKGYFRSEVRGIERIPEGGALLVSNHSGGFTAMDVPVLTVAYVEHFGPDKPIYTLAHDLLFTGAGKEIFGRFGFLRAHPRNAVRALKTGAPTIVFPGGDREALRPTADSATIDFGGRTGYLRTALEAGVPIVPVVTIGGQETQLFLGRNEWLGRLLQVNKIPGLRTTMMPATFGFPFGLNVGIPFNLPLPSKLVTQILEPIDIRADYGPDPDIEQVDEMVRKHMQHALDELAAQRRLPIIG